MFKNDDELNAALLNDFMGMIDELTIEFLNKLLEYIETEVYDVGSPQWYDRNKLNGGLLGSFEASNTKKVMQRIFQTIAQNPNSMILDSDEFIHGSNYWVMDDIRDLLTEIVVEGKSGKLFGDGFWRQPRDFWTPMMDFLQTAEADKIFENIMTKHGIVWKKI